MSVYDRIFKEISENNTNIVFDSDKVSKQKYLTFSSYDDALKCREAFGTFINEKTEAAGLSNVTYLDFSSNKYTPAIEDPNAPKLNIVTVKLDNNHLIIINNADLETVRKEFLGDKTEYTHSVIFKNAEYHGYPHFKNLKTGVESLPGTSVKPFGKWFGENIVRNERAYEDKYYRGNVFIKAGINPKENKASFGVEVLITKEQLEIAKKVFSKYSEDFAKSAPKAQYLNASDASKLSKGLYFFKQTYHDGENFYCFYNNTCHDSIARLFREMGFKGHFLNFVRADNLDMNDQGTFYDAISAHGTYTICSRIPFAEIVNKHVPLFKQSYDLGYLDSSTLSYSLLLEQANQQDKDGNNALHQALIMNDIKKATLLIDKLGVDVNVPNKRGEIALHLVAKMKPSDEKLVLLKKVVDATSDINAPDLFGDNIPLSFAVWADDPAAIKFMVEHGANLHFVNDTHEKLSNIAAEHSAKNAAKALQELDPEIMYHDNLNRQVPIHHPNIKDALEIPEEIPVKAKTVEEEYVMIGNINPYFDILVSHSTQPEIV